MYKKSNEITGSSVKRSIRRKSDFGHSAQLRFLLFCSFFFLLSTRQISHVLVRFADAIGTFIADFSYFSLFFWAAGGNEPSRPFSCIY